MKKREPQPFRHSPLVLCYRRPARENHEGWEREALPVGNGYMGAKIFGGVAREHIQFNEKTLWSGGPGVSGYDGGNALDDGGKAVIDIYTLLKNGEYRRAARRMSDLEGDTIGLGAFQNFMVCAAQRTICARWTCVRLSHGSPFPKGGAAMSGSVL